MLQDALLEVGGVVLQLEPTLIAERARKISLDGLILAI